jgi:hypothetical protein
MERARGSSTGRGSVLSLSKGGDGKRGTPAPARSAKLLKALLEAVLDRPARFT